MAVTCESSEDGPVLGKRDCGSPELCVDTGGETGAFCTLEPTPNAACDVLAPYACQGDVWTYCRSGYVLETKECIACSAEAFGCVGGWHFECESDTECIDTLSCVQITSASESSCERPCDCPDETSCAACADMPFRSTYYPEFHCWNGVCRAIPG